MSKVVLTREQAEALAWLLAKEVVEEEMGYWTKKELMLEHAQNPNGWHEKAEAINGMSMEKLVKALYIGYEVKLDFKVGEWVVDPYYGVTRIKEVEEQGVWIESGNSKEWRKNLSDVYRDMRHATEKEIKKTKRNRWWKSHDRKEWELKKGDVLRYTYETKGIFHEVKYVSTDGLTVKLNNMSNDFNIVYVSENFVVVNFEEDRRDIIK